jgi:hypothetical protein
MQNNMTSQDLEVGIGKKCLKLDFWMFNILRKKFPGTLLAILHKKTWTAYFGVKLNLHSLETGKDL